MPGPFPTHVPADAQRRFVSKQRAFGAASSSPSSSDSGAAEATAPDAKDGAAPAWQQQLCSAELAGGVPPYRMLKGSCSLTSRKVGACAAVPWLRVPPACLSLLPGLLTHACLLPPAAPLHSSFLQFRSRASLRYPTCPNRSSPS